MRISLIITTYNRPDALHLVLQSVLHQSRLPDEIVIADDGSGPETGAMLDGFRSRCPIPILHAWQEDKGFRAARVRNLAASKASADYFIFIDGDMVLHPVFIASHARFAHEGYFLHGKRAMLSKSLTARVIRNGSYRISPLRFGIGLWKYAWHSDLLAGRMSYQSTSWYDTQSANLSMWSDDLYRVNGFNEAFEGWGREDSELAFRLVASGLTKCELRFCAIAFHLAHGKDNRVRYAAHTARNQALLDEIVGAQSKRCEQGISGHPKHTEASASEH